jgi:hypothetical protein
MPIEAVENRLAGFNNALGSFTRKEYHEWLLLPTEAIVTPSLTLDTLSRHRGRQQFVPGAFSGTFPGVLRLSSTFDSVGLLYPETADDAHIA